VYRLSRTTVTRTVRVAPHFVRITFGGADLAGFGHAGHDQRVKILLPRPGRTLDDVPTGSDWYPRWRRLPDAVRPTMRTYTVRAFRPDEHELDVDFVLHGGDGTASGVLSSWAAGARPGDEIGLLGPDRPGAGRLWGAEWAPPAGTARALVLGDETAVPAIGAILDAVPGHLQVTACAEVPDEADVLPWEGPRNARVSWLVRRRPGGESPRGALLEAGLRAALSAMSHRAAPGATGTEPDPEDPDNPDIDPDDALLWDVPVAAADASQLYVWMAGEAGVMRALRRIARTEFGLPRSAVACMGYWRDGQPELP
jgi:NADPH-dependent ferric siderophore reductase